MEPAGIVLNFSQACQNKMFSALTSDLRKVCRERHTLCMNTSGATHQKSHGNYSSVSPEPVENHSTTWGQLLLTVKWWIPQGSSSSFSNDTAQLSTLLAGPDSPPGVPGRLELLPPQPRVDMFNSAAHPDTNTPIYHHPNIWQTVRLNQIFSSETHIHAQTCFSKLKCWLFTLTSVWHRLDLHSEKEKWGRQHKI